MIPISEKLLAMLNAQCAHELGNRIIYLHVSSWAQQRGLKGISSYFSTQADGEGEHFNWIRDIIADANAQLSVAPIDQKPFQFSSCEEIARLYVETEGGTTDRLEAIAHVADSEYNIGVQDLMQKMLREQIEEEGSADRFTNLVQIAGGDLIKLDLALR